MITAWIVANIGNVLNSENALQDSCWIKTWILSEKPDRMLMNRVNILLLKVVQLFASKSDAIERHDALHRRYLRIVDDLKYLSYKIKLLSSNFSRDFHHCVS